MKCESLTKGLTEGGSLGRRQSQLQSVNDTELTQRGGLIHLFTEELELELIQPHMAQKSVLRGEVGCACVAREVSVERGGMC